MYAQYFGCNLNGGMTMQFITRTIRYYICTFGTYDIESGKMCDVRNVTLSYMPGPRKIAELSEQYGICFAKEEVTKTLCLPLDDFVRVSLEWMSTHDERPRFMETKDEPEMNETDNMEDNNNG